MHGAEVQGWLITLSTLFTTGDVFATTQWEIEAIETFMSSRSALLGACTLCAM